MDLNLTLIRESFNAIKPHADEVVDHFYETLLRDHASLRPLFKHVDLKKQKRALINALVHIVEYADETDHLVDYLKKMGARHVRYGVEESHYPMVGQTLLATFQYYFDEQWTPELEQEWSKVIQLVATTMIAGMKAQAPAPVQRASPPTAQEMARSVARELVKRALEEELKEELMSYAKDYARKLIQKAVEDEARDLLSPDSKKAA